MEQPVIAARDEDLPWNGLSVHRGNPRPYKTFPIETAVPGLNLQLSLSRITDFYSPRHRHNFEQIRYAVEGSYSSGKQTMKQGQVGYFPEGCYYGPQDQHGAALLLVLQFPGPSDGYYMTDAERDAAYERLKTRGTFSGGIYTTIAADGRKKNKDSFEAIWEEHNQRKLSYPPPRYAEPVVMDPSIFGWRAHSSEEDLDVKHLGIFGEDQTGLWFLRFKAGGSVRSERLAAPEIRYVTNGSVTYDGVEFGPGSYFYIPAGSPTKAAESADGCDLLVISLPMIVRHLGESQASVAA